MPRSAADVRYPLRERTISGRELERIALAHASRASEPIRDHSAAWSQALLVLEARSQGRVLAKDRRDAVRRAARYLNAAVNGRLGEVNETVSPLEPTDDPSYEERVEERLANEERLAAIRSAIEAENAHKEGRK